MVRHHGKNIATLFSVMVCTIILSATFAVFLNAQYIYDQFNVWFYKPTEEVNQLATRSGLSERGNFVYLASQPTLDGTQNFNSVCESIENVTSILGCYKDNKIYIYDVSDQKLDGIREVTAAHETLHAVYTRLGDKDREYVDGLLSVEYEKIKEDVNFKPRMEFYARTEPGQLNNELHSVIGTEIADISPELENYYSKYFSDRQSVVILNQKYQSVFADLKDQADSINAQINNLVSNINQKSNEYNSSVNLLNTDISDFNYRADNSWFVSQSQFEQERSGLATRVSQLEADRTSISDSIDQYESLVTKYNSIATESKKLYNSLDSSLAPAPSI